MSRTQLNIECTSAELKAWKLSALEDDTSLVQWVKGRLNKKESNPISSLLSKLPKPKTDLSNPQNHIHPITTP